MAPRKLGPLGTHANYICEGHHANHSATCVVVFPDGDELLACATLAYDALVVGAIIRKIGA